MSSTDTNQASEDSMGLDDLLTKFYEDSVDAYHAFMGTYTDTESDETAPDRLIDSACVQILALIRTEKLKLLAEVRERVVGEDKPLQGKYRASGLMSYDMTNHYENSLRAEQRAVLTKLEAEL